MRVLCDVKEALHFDGMGACIMTRFDRLAYQYVAATLAAACLFLVASYYARQFLSSETSPAVQVLVSLIAVLPMLLAVWALVRYFRQSDERERHVITMAGAITLLIGVVIALFLGKVEPLFPLGFNEFAALLLALWSLVSAFVRWKS
jgi:uncharacterized membrane protein HdeD (DUF308 family)